ncbi:hypothetical protein BLA29_013227, partial [Euroglyphus maynei]
MVIGGFETRMWHLASEYLNFTIEWSAQSDRRFGIELENKSWSGMIGRLIDNQIDIAVGGFIITKKRYDMVDFFHPYGQEKFTFAYPPIPDTGSNIDLLIQPFHCDVYIAILF